MNTCPVVGLWWLFTSRHDHWHDRQDEITCMSSRDPLHVLVARFAWCSWVAIHILLTWHIYTTLTDPVFLLIPNCLIMKRTVSFKIWIRFILLNIRYALAPVWGHYPLNLPWPSLTSSILFQMGRLLLEPQGPAPAGPCGYRGTFVHTGPKVMATLTSSPETTQQVVTHTHKHAPMHMHVLREHIWQHTFTHCFFQSSAFLIAVWLVSVSPCVVGLQQQ